MKQKNVYKAFGVIAIAVIIGFLMIACDDTQGGSPPDDGIKTPLSAPTNLSVTATTSDLSLTWSSVDNAASYDVQIGSASTSVSTTTYSLKSLALVELKPYTFNVKAVAPSNSNYTDSDYAQLTKDIAPYVFEFENATGAAQNITARATSSGGVKITGLTSFGKTLTSVNIPGTIDGVSVTVIAGGAFTGSAAVSVSIPDTVTSIEAKAFEGSAALATVIFNGDTPPEIDKDAFSGVTTLKEIVVPAGSAGDYESALPDTVSNIISDPNADPDPGTGPGTGPGTDPDPGKDPGTDLGTDPDPGTGPGTGPGDGDPKSGDGNFSVGFDVTDAAAGATLSSGDGESIDDLTISLGDTITLTVANQNNQYSNIEWFVNGTDITETGNSFELDSGELNVAGTYTITIKVEYNKMPYSRTIAVTVEEQGGNTNEK